MFVIFCLLSLFLSYLNVRLSVYVKMFELMSLYVKFDCVCVHTHARACVCVCVRERERERERERVKFCLM